MSIALHCENLTRMESELLRLMQANSGRVFARRELIQITMGEDCPSGARTIDVHIASLRKKLGSSCIQTVRGRGYFAVSERPTA